MAELIGKYEVVRTLGQGAMGTVYLARDPLIDRSVAIKLLRTDSGEDPERFRQEARVVGALSHPHIVVLHDVGFHEGRLYLVMQYVPGQSLEDWLREPHALAEHLRIMDGLIGALGYAHGRGVLHRDLKPSNVQVTPDGEGCLMDFGIARAPETKLTATGTIMGTPAYIAPEVLADAEYSPRADHYSLALVFYEMLGGSNPFLGKSLPATLANVVTLEPPALGEVRPGLSRELAEAVMAHLARDAARRPPDLARLQQVVRRLRSGAGAESAEAGLGDPSATRSILDVGALKAPAPRPPSRVRRGAWLAAGVVGLALAYWVASRQPPAPGDASRAASLGPPSSAPAGPAASATAMPQPSGPVDATPGPRVASPQPARSQADAAHPTPGPGTAPASAGDEPTPTPEEPRPPPAERSAGAVEREPRSGPPEPTPDPSPTPTPVATPTPAPTPTPEPDPPATAATAAREMAAPRLTGLSPRSGRRGNVAVLEVSGTGFRSGQEVRLLRAGRPVPGLRVTKLSVDGPERIRLTLFISPDVPLGSYSLVLVDAEGRQSPPIGFEVVL